MMDPQAGCPGCPAVLRTDPHTPECTYWTHTVTGGPWPERIGLRCRIAPPPADIVTYPWYKRHPREVAILVENDPLTGPGTGYGMDVWSCCLDRDHITPIHG